MAYTFESSRGNSDESEIILNRFEFKSVSQKYINRNYERIGRILGIEGKCLGNIKRHANAEKQLPDIQGELTLDQINFYREHYDFPPLTQDEYDSIKSQNTSTEATIDEQSEEVVTEVKQSSIDANFLPSVIIDIPDNASTKLSPNNVQSAAESLYHWGNVGFPEGDGPIKSIEHARALVEGKGRLLWPERIPGINDDEARNAMAMGRVSPNVESMKASYLQFYGVIEPEIEVERAEVEVQSDEADTIKRQTIDTEADTTKVSEGQDESPSLKGENLADVSKAEVTESTNPDLDELQSELSRLVTEAANKLNIEQEQENNQEYSSRLDREKIDIFTENAKQAIQDYQKFASEHSAPFDNSNAEIQKRYLELERTAWDALYKLAHYLDGEIATLPQDRDIQLSHPEGVDTRQYLEERGYKFDENGYITDITDNGIEIELNRPVRIESLIKSKRPSRVLYPNPFKSSAISNDIQDGFGTNINIIKDKEQIPSRDWNRPITNNVDLDRYSNRDRPSYYNSYLTKGYLINGLNKNTPDFLLGVLDKEHLETVIVDETKQVNNSSKVIKDPWIEESKGETEFEQIFADSLKNKDEISGNVGTPDPWLERTEQPEVETADIPQTHPDFGSVYYQESQRWNYLQSLEEQYRDNPKDKEIEKDLTEMRKTYQEFIDRINNDPNQDKFRDFLALRQSYAKEEASNTMDRFRKAIGLSQHNETELALSRERYNTALQELLKTEVSDKVSLNIKQLFSDEFSRLRDERAQQTRELQGPETRIDRLKNRFLKFATKHKSIISGVNFLLLGGSLFAAGTGIGIPVAGAMDVSRRFIGGVMAGVSGRETIRSNFEDLNTDLNVNLTKGINIKTNFNILKSNNKDRNLNLNIKGINFKTNFERLKTKGAITKLVEKSLKGDYINKASDTELLKIISTLDAYYGLNGGRFTESNQQKAYEMATYALGKKVENSIQPNSETSDTLDANSTSSKDEVSIESNSNTQDIAQSPDYMNELLTRVSIDRVRELNKQKNIRLGANTAGFLIGGTLLGSLAADMHRPGGVFNPNDNPDAGASVPKTEAGSGPGGAPTGESFTPKPTTEPISPNPSETPGTRGLGEPPSAPDAPPTGSGGEALSQSEQLAQSAEATRAAAEQAAQQAAEQAAEQLAQDVSSLDPGESIWTEVAKQLKGATDTQIQQAVENLLQSAEGQNSIYKLAQGTEGGRALLSQWGIDNASEMAILSKERLYEISRYLAPGELQGITELSLENLTPFETVEATQVDVSEAMDNSTPATEASAPSVEPTLSAAPEATDSPEVSPIAGTEFTENLSKALGANGLTESQLQNVIYSFATSENGSAELYNQIISNDEGVRFLSGFGVNSSADFTNLRPDELYEIAQTVGVDNLDKLTGFELNEIILSQFENAPDTVELIRGSRPLDVVNQYIANELGNLPYDPNLGKQVLDTYVQTDLGKQWLYDAIVNNPDVNNQNIQYFKEYLRFKDIKSPEEFISKFNWSEFSGNKNIPTSGFWNQIRLPNGGTRLQPLSTFLQPGKMVGIPEAIRQVLIKQ